MLHQVSASPVQQLPLEPWINAGERGGNTCEPVRQNWVYSSLYFFHSFFHWAECNGTDCQADSATAQKKRPYRWWALREFSILILSHGIVQQPLREREKKTVPLLSIYTVPWCYTKQALGRHIMGSFAWAWRATKDREKKKRFNVKFWCLFFLFLCSSSHMMMLDWVIQRYSWFLKDAGCWNWCHDP